MEDRPILGSPADEIVGDGLQHRLSHGRPVEGPLNLIAVG